MVEEQMKYLKRNNEVKVFRHDLKLTGNRIRKDWDNFITLAREHKKLAKEIDSKNFDICLVHPDKLTQAPFLLRYLKTPTLYFCEELLRIVYEKELEYMGPFVNQAYENITRLFRKKIDRDNARGATKVATASNFINRKVKRAYGMSAKVLPLGVDLKVFRPTSRQKHKSLLFVGANDEINGYSFATQVAESAGLPLDVIDGHKLTDRELSSKYSESMATLCVSYSEPFGLVALESMACETPVLAIDGGGYKETVIDRGTGYLLRRDVREFVRKIEKLKKDSDLIRKLGKAGRKHVVNNFTWGKHGKFLEKELKKLVDS